MDQHTFVKSCYSYYEKNDLTPGNPEDGKWEKAHYPVPECRDGTETILLLCEHHHIQGVLQSLEFDTQCFWPTAKYYLKGSWMWLLPAYFAYNRHSENFTKNLTAEQVSENARKAAYASLAVRTPEQLSDWGRQMGELRFASLKENLEDFFQFQRNASYASARKRRGKTIWEHSKNGERVFAVERPGPEWLNTEERRRLRRRKKEEEKVGQSWWVNADGETLRQDDYPGEGWRRGKKMGTPKTQTVGS
jgi:hypothetical protein